ncbi:MAG: MBOAT family protein [Cyclobacteriaceae bacterium]|nr:MBOAT family protein [Cyclobacteriaceae bacterium]
MAFLMLFSAWVDFFVAKRIYKSFSKKLRTIWLLVSLVINFGLLFFFKYSYFIDYNVGLLFNDLGFSYEGLSSSGFKIILPLGISFYTFQSVSYSIDIYRGVTKPEDNFIYFATYITFWPQLIAGPILRAEEVIPQLKNDPVFKWDNLEQGIFRIIFGCFKKIVLADSIGSMVDAGFLSNISFLTAWDVWVLAILFGFQIYFDFAGYSDIAIGTARLLNIYFPENFNWPYLAETPREFWRRWHISLSSWIRDYLYLPLQGLRFNNQSVGGIDIGLSNNKKASQLNAGVALFVTWFIMGLWHGAGWNFALWGIYHALIIFVYRLFPFLNRLSDRFNLFGIVLTFLIIMAGWIPFRSQSITQALDLFTIILTPSKYLVGASQLHISYALYAFILVLFMVLIHQYILSKPYKLYGYYIKLSSIPIIVFLVIIHMKQMSKFIYFQF